MGTTAFDKSEVVSERSTTATLMMLLARPQRSWTLLKLGIMKQTFYSTLLTSRSGRVLSVFAQGRQALLPAGSDWPCCYHGAQPVLLETLDVLSGVQQMRQRPSCISQSDLHHHFTLQPPSGLQLVVEIDGSLLIISST